MGKFGQRAPHESRIHTAIAIELLLERKITSAS
jgi:hypothetical protein